MCNAFQLHIYCGFRIYVNVSSYNIVSYLALLSEEKKIPVERDIFEDPKDYLAVSQQTSYFAQKFKFSVSVQCGVRMINNPFLTYVFTNGK